MSPLNENHSDPGAGTPPQAPPTASRDEADASMYWRSIRELTRDPELAQRMQQEFPEALTKAEGISRRQFSSLMAASLALAGSTLSGCRRWPEREVRPLAERPEGYVPGVARYFATQFELGGVATGVVAKSIDGRPIKIDGNAMHPFSLGAAGPFAQATVLELYDPDRTRGYVFRPANAPRQGETTPDSLPPPTVNTREKFEAIMKAHFAELQKSKGRGLHVLSQFSSGPTLHRLRLEFQAKFPDSRWHVYEPVDRDNETAGAELAFGQPLRPQFHLQQAETIVCLAADPLGMHPAAQRHCRDWAATRKPDASINSRVWSFEPNFTITGAAADNRVPATTLQVEDIAFAIAAQLGVVASGGVLSANHEQAVSRLVTYLKSSKKRSLLIAGPTLSSEAHAVVHAVNQHLGSVGTTVTFVKESLAESKPSVAALADLVGSMTAKSVETLLILGGNPVFDAPVDLALPFQNQRRLTSIYLGLFENETAQQCTWHAPSAHFLEAWNDGRAWDGTYGVGQPLIHPLFNGISEIEFLSLTLGRPVENGLQLVRETAQTEFGVADDGQWSRLLHDGVLPNSRLPNVEPPKVQADKLKRTQTARAAAKYELCLVPDGSTYDGRFANNGWLQELPDPLTKLTWGNAALLSKADADELRLSNGDLVKIATTDGHLLDDVPVLVQPGQARGSIALPLGYGRETGTIAKDVGVNAGRLRTSAPRFVSGVASIARTGRRTELACTQEHHLVDPVGMAGRTRRVGERGKSGMLVRETSLEDFRRAPEQVHASVHVPAPAPLFDQPDSFKTPHAWGMAIDLNVCVGCNACTIACQAENNIPIVGKENVLINREMHWIRIDRYFKGEVESADVVHVPMACVQCEDAPCEQVCPVAATVHDTEGLNAMVYNRCVGTRYCANNCPFKVRRFNYFDYHATRPTAPPQPWVGIPDQQPSKSIDPLQQMVFNPEVTVRLRGVMEKCTYCVQRIVNARIHAKNEFAQGQRDKSTLADGEVVTACQQSCPTQAIQFGDLNDPNSLVSKAHRDLRAYAMLEETNIKPRTRHLARIRNRSAGDAQLEDGHGHG